VEVLDEAEAGRVVADLVERLRPTTLGVATGSSPRSTYAELARRSPLPSINALCLLDEYVGLPPDDPHRFRSEIIERVAAPLGLDAARVFGPDVDAADLEQACRDYEALLTDLGGIDVQLLGIGRNGHIGFNEPGTSGDARTHISALSPETRADNARFFDDPAAVPHRAITQGPATIADARHIVLIAVGRTKAEAIAALTAGPASPDLPARVLCNHRDVVVVADAAALSLTLARVEAT
jgi:glucosamine-6-phosphate deaminase